MNLHTNARHRFLSALMSAAPLFGNGRAYVLATALIASLALNACGGRGSSSSSASSAVLPAVASPTAQLVSNTSNSDSQAVQVNLLYILPASAPSSQVASQSSAQRDLKYIATTNQNITITVTPLGGAATVVGPTPCTNATCVVSFTALPGPTTLAFSLTDIGGVALSAFTTTSIIQPRTINTLKFTANPIVKTVVLSLANANPNGGTALNDLLTVNALDADTNIIVGKSNYIDANGNPVSFSLGVTNSQAGGRGTVAIKGPLRVTAPGQAAIYAYYDGKWLDNSTISVTTSSSTGILGSAATLTTKPEVGKSITFASTPTALAAGADGNLWLASGNQIRRITPSGTTTTFNDPTGTADIEGMTAGPDGNLWYGTCNNSNLGRITLTGIATDFPVTTGVACVYQPDANYSQALASGPDRMIWFATNSNQVAKSSVDGAITYYTMPANAAAVAAGADGNMWIASAVGSKIWKMTTSGTLLGTYTIPTANADVMSMIAAPDGNVWFTEENGDKVGKITPSGSITEYPLTGGNAGPTQIIVGPDGNMWYTDGNTSQITRITPNGVRTNYAPSGAQFPDGIALGSDGNLWYMDPFAKTLSAFVY